MNKKIILTSFIALGFAYPAIATEFPSNGLMQANQTYDNAAIDTNMAGVYENGVYANAQYEDILYNIAAGRYLEGGSELENGTQCPAGSWCPGLTNAYYSVNDQGINTCPNTHASSLAGSDENTDCYRTCTTNDAAHSTGTVNGKMFYNGTNGDGVSTCEPTDCVNGWHLKSSTPDLTTVIGTSQAGVSDAYLNGSGTFYEENANQGQSYYGITTNRTWAVDYGVNKGILIGVARCSSVSGTNNNNTWSNPTTLTTNEIGSEGGQYCYCNITKYVSSANDTQEISSLWVYKENNNFAASCSSNCPLYCASTMSSGTTSDRNFRAALFGTVIPGLASCAANTITITWNGTTQTEIDANEAGTATYGGDIRTPRSATHVPGKTFTGWRFSTTAPSNE